MKTIGGVNKHLIIVCESSNLWVKRIIFVLKEPCQVIVVSSESKIVLSVEVNIEKMERLELAVPTLPLPKLEKMGAF